MFSLGLLSLLQVWFLPGLALLVFAKKIRLIDKLILSLPLSVTLNYIIVFSLIIFNSYNQITLFILILIEIFLIILFLKKDNFVNRDIKKIVAFFEFKKLKAKFNVIDIFIIFIFLIYLFLALSNVGNVLGKGDSVTYYMWTLDLINNQIPVKSYDYPQGAAILSSISFVLLNTLEIEFFSAAIFLIQPLWIFLIFYRSVFLLKKFDNQIKFSLIFVSIIVIYNFRHYLLYVNLPDATVALGTIFGAYILILILKYVKVGLNIETILFCFVMAYTALLKQVGIYTSILFPIIYSVLFYKKDKNVLKNFLLIFSIIFLIFSPWYLFKFYQSNIYGVNESSIWNVATSYNNYENLFFHIFEVLKRLFGYAYIFVLILVYFSLKEKFAQKIFFVFLLPYFIIYTLTFGYEFRAFAPAMAVVGILCGVGMNNLIETIKVKFKKNNIISIYRISIFFLMIFSLFFLNEIRDFEKLKYLNSQAMKKRGDYELNVLLYNFLDKNDKIKDIYVVRDYNDLQLLPEMNHKFWDSSCLYFSEIYKKNLKKSYYILIDLNEVNSKKYKQSCKTNLFNLIESKEEKKYIKKIFEYKNYIMYLRKYN